MKRLEEMNLFDDFLFWHLLANKAFGPAAAKIILGTILQKPIGELTVHTQEAVYGVDSDKHGIRMDAYVTETDLQTGDGTVRRIRIKVKRPRFPIEPGIIMSWPMPDAWIPVRTISPFAKLISLCFCLMILLEKEGCFIR